LVGSRSFFEQGDPHYRGGGTVEIVTLEDVQWTNAPERDEAGSPNVLGALALAAALQQLNEAGMENIAAHEADLTAYALRKLNRIAGVRIYGSADPQRMEDRVGVIPIELQDMPHAKLAAILGFEAGIGVRNGCFCAHPYVLRLLGISHAEYLQHREQLARHDRSNLPGFVRISFGCYNNFEDVDRLVEMLERIAAGDYRGDYHAHPLSGSYYPAGFQLESLKKYLSL
jgi:selenocysteine lyase/cysteine desulfurase